MRLEHSRLKIKRANSHIADIEARIIALHTTDTAVVETHPQYGTERLKHNFSDVVAFEDIALMLGDAIHNLKCALDYTWLKTIERLVPALVDDRAKFPVRKTIKEVEGFLAHAEVHTFHPNLFAFMLHTIKPCEGGNDAIWNIHNFDNRDKHRLLIPVLAQGHIDGIEVEDERGEAFKGSGAGDFQRPPYCIDFKPGLHVKQKGKLTADIAVEDEKSGCFMHIPETLIRYSHIISKAVELFERFLEAEPG
jgi:hypothetical protein